MVPNTSTHKTVPLFANILVKAWLTTQNISKDQAMTALQLKDKMITAFKPHKPDRPRTHCLKQDKRMKKWILFVNDENSKRNVCSYCISKTYCHDVTECVVYIVQELCESRGGRPGLSILTSLLVSVDVKIYCTVLRHWSQLVPNMSHDIWGH